MGRIDLALNALVTELGKVGQGAQRNLDKLKQLVFLRLRAEDDVGLALSRGLLRILGGYLLGGAFRRVHQDWTERAYYPADLLLNYIRLFT